MPRSPARLMVLLAPLPFILAGCPPVEEPALDARAQLVRLSVDLRGVHPSEEELSVIEEEPDLYLAYVDLWLEDPRLEERLREVWNLRFLARTGEPSYEEPLRLLSWIARHDLPYSELVTADYTMADPGTALLWDIDIPGFGGWEPGRYRDDRPMAGVLSMSTLWQRYPSAGGNANRHRANAVSRLLLCDDYLDRPIVFTRRSVDDVAEDPEDTVRQTPACQSCHSTLDPLAAHFYGFWGDEYDGLYRPERELLWMDYTGSAPAWYGTPTSNLVELGGLIAEDPRFIDCAVQTAFEGFIQREVGPDDWADVQALRGAFEESGLQLKALIRALVTSDAYLSDVRRVSPAQLAGVIEGITGFRWRIGDEDALTTPDLGFAVLAGGVGAEVAAPNWSPSVSLALIQERLAWLAAWHVVRRDLVDAEEPQLLVRATLQTHPDTDGAAFAATVADLVLAVRGRALEPDSPEPARLARLFSQVYSVDGSAEMAWAAVVAAALRDSAVLFY